MEILYAVLVVGIIAFVLGILLGLASKYLSVKEDPRLEKLLELLPGYNCGACGKPGCQGMANALLENSIKVSACKPSKEKEQKEIKKYLSETKGPNGQVVNVEI